MPAIDYQKHMPMAYFLYRAAIDGSKDRDHHLSQDYGLALSDDQRKAIAAGDAHAVTQFLVKECMYQDPTMAMAANGLTFTL
jgi:hypothetical protein